MRRPGLVAILLYLGVSCLWSWPLVVTDGPLPARNFDAFCVQWAAAAATRLDWTLTDPLSQWPLGNSLARSDSFLYFLLARLLTPLLGADGLVNALALLAPAISAWAAERTARRVFGVAAPWSLVAGLVYAFNGLSATMLLEGHVYLLLTPWLPLLLGALHREAPRDGVWAAAWWALCLLTSAYVGIGATLVVAVYAFAALLRGRLAGGTYPTLLAACAILGGAYAAWFAAAPDPYEGVRLGSARAVSEMTHGSARLGLLVGWSPVVDDAGHSFWPSLSAGALALCLFVAVVGGVPRRIQAVGLLALLLAFGPQLDVYRPDDLGIPWLLSPLAGSELAARFRFPSRLLLPAGLALALAAATILARLSLRTPRHAAAFAGAVLLEATFGAGLPWRTRPFEGGPPSAYAAAPAGWAVLDLLPTFSGPGEVDLAFYFDRLSCRWQAFHGRPVLAQCVDTRPYAGLAAEVGGEVLGRLVEGEGASLADDLRSAGIGALTVRPDLLPPSDRRTVLAALDDALGPVAATSTDGGDPLHLWRVPGTGGQAPSAEASRGGLTKLTGRPR